MQSHLLTSLTLLGKAGRSLADQDAWRSFVERYRPIILHWCGRRNLPVHDSEEIASDVLTKLMHSLARYDSSKGRFRAWLKTVVNNAITDWQRREASRPATYSDDFGNLMKRLSDSASIADLFDEVGSSVDHDFVCQTEAIERVRAALEPHRWEAFYRTVVENEKPADVAAALQRSPNEVYQAKFYVLKRLRAEYDKLRSAPKRGSPP